MSKWLLLIVKIHVMVLCIMLSGCSELRIEKEKLKQKYLTEVPLGSTYDDVMLKLATLSLSNELVFHDKGGCSINGRRTKGHIIRANMGWYFDGILPRYAWTVWCFDENKHLVDLKVIKETDSP